MDTLPSLVLRNVTLPSGRVADITLADGRVTHVGASTGTADCLDCTGLLVLPAAIDMHVHMRGGTQSAKGGLEERQYECTCRGSDGGGRPAQYRASHYNCKTLLAIGFPMHRQIHGAILLSTAV